MSARTSSPSWRRCPRALDRAGFRLIASGLQQCVTERGDGTIATADEERLERLFLSLA